LTKTTIFNKKDRKWGKKVGKGRQRSTERDVNMGFAWGIAEISTGARTFEHIIHLFSSSTLPHMQM